MMAIALALTVVAVVVIIIVRGEAEEAVASEAVAAEKSSLEPLVRSYPPPLKPRVEEAKELQPMAEPNPEPSPKPEPELKADPRPEPEPKLNAQSKPTSPTPLRSDQPNINALPAEEAEWQRPSEEELEAASIPRRYELPPGAIMSLTVEAMDIYNVPVFDSDSQQALQDGVAHVPETSLPWSPSPQRTSTSQATAWATGELGAGWFSTTWISWMSEMRSCSKTATARSTDTW